MLGIFETSWDLPTASKWKFAWVISTNTYRYYTTEREDTWISIKTQTTDSKYSIRNIDKQATYTYFWFQTAGGAFKIMRKTNATKAFEYAYWSSDYTTARTWRVSLTYWAVQ